MNWLFCHHSSYVLFVCVRAKPKNFNFENNICTCVRTLNNSRTNWSKWLQSAKWSLWERAFKYIMIFLILCDGHKNILESRSGLLVNQLLLQDMKFLVHFLEIFQLTVCVCVCILFSFSLRSVYFFYFLLLSALLLLCTVFVCFVKRINSHSKGWIQGFEFHTFLFRFHCI